MNREQLVRAAKNKLRAAHRKVRRNVVGLFFSYDKPDLVRALHEAGVSPGDSVMLHSAFEAHHGFRGSVEDAIDAFLEALGPQGNLLMVSLPYRTSSFDYLTKLKSFDVRKTPSAMGLVSEFFRRRDSVRRSVHPTHPILACGARSDWFTAGHEHCLYPCGPGTPFEKLLEANGKVVFFNVPFAYFTFFHFLEHYVSSNLHFPLYHPTPFEVPVIDGSGQSITVRTVAFSKSIIPLRRFEVLEEELWRHRVIRTARVGASKLLIVDLRDVMRVVDEMVRRGVFFYEMQKAS